MQQQIEAEKKKYEDLLEEKLQSAEDNERREKNEHIERKKIENDVKSVMQEVTISRHI